MFQKKIKLHFFTLLLTTLFYSNVCYALPMKVVSATVHQFQIPVLIGKDINQLIHIKIETEGDKNPISLNKLVLKLSY